jgi:hypothetical protein
VTKTSELAKVQVRVDESSRQHWLRIAQLAGLTEPFSEEEMARLSELVDTRKRSNFENEKRKKIKVDELGKYVRMESFELIGMHVTT